MKMRIHKIRHGNQNILFFCDSLGIVKVTDEDVSCIENIMNGLTVSEAEERGEKFFSL